MKIGDIAQETGLSVRALRHYEEVGLLSPARGEGDQRVYSLGDLTRLQNILFLKQMGLSLDEIRASLARPSLEVIERRIAQVEQSLSELRSSLESLRASRSLLASGHELTAEQLIENLKGAAMFEKYYTQDQRDELAKRADPKLMEEAGLKWADLIARVQSAVDQGVDPHAPEARKMADEWTALVSAFTGGSAGIEKNLGKMYAENPDMQARYGLNSKLFEFIRAAKS